MLPKTLLDYVRYLEVFAEDASARLGPNADVTPPERTKGLNAILGP
ncbi:MAG: hypothetical protein ACHQ2Y_04350 [Candidatus Lutacidiplasmatales archaeon]